MEIKTDDYVIAYHKDTATIICEGSLLLSGSDEYAPILDLLTKAADDQDSHLTLDLRELEFLNSSGINTLTKFVISIRNRQTLSLTGIGYEEIPWQVRLLKNLQRLMPDLELVLK
jgi:hypothetical protein